MTRVYLADAQLDDRFALRLLLMDLEMELAGEAEGWTKTLAEAPANESDILLVDWDLLPAAASGALAELRAACPVEPVIVLLSHLDAQQQAAASIGADAFISKDDTPQRIAERLQSVAASVSVLSNNQPNA
jgi:DNA-binding NarL/FixJ family response regulator